MDEKHSDFDKRPPVPVADYDQLIQQLQPNYDGLFVMIRALLEAQLGDKESKLLVVGAGSGKELVTFGKANPHWSLLGVDPSQNMLEIARRKLQAEGLTERVSLHQGFTHQLPAITEYDGATCVMVNHFLPDDGSKLALLQSVAVRLKPGGCFILVDMHGDTSTADFKVLLAGMEKYQEIAGLSPEWVRSNTQNVVLKTMYFVPEPRIIELLEAAGFEKVSRFYNGFLLGGWIAFKQ